jgi:hypothetical protein
MSSVHVLPWRYVHLAYVVLVAEFVDASMTLPAARTVQMDEREQNSTKSALGSFEVAASFFGWEILTYHPLS